MAMNAQQKGTWYLRVVQGEMSGQSFVISRSVVTVGRDPGIDIVLDVPSVSRRHARLTYQDGWFHVQDLGSANGVVVNGVRVADERERDLVLAAMVRMAMRHHLHTPKRPEND